MAESFVVVRQLFFLCYLELALFVLVGFFNSIGLFHRHSNRKIYHKNPEAELVVDQYHDQYRFSSIL
jgi:hypothetical protein